MASEFLRLKAEMPFLGVGIGLRGEICDEILANKALVDFLEFTPENYRENNATIGWLSQFADIFPLASHSVSLSIGSIDPLDRDLLTMIRFFLKKFKIKWWSDHLCFTGVDGQNANDLFPLPWTEEAVKHVAARVKESQEIVESPLILENIPFYTQMPQGDFDEAEFIARTLEEADCGLLLDLNNLFVNSLNHKFDPHKYLDNIPLERVVQIHMAGPGRFGNRVIDTHGSPVPEPVFELLQYALSKGVEPKAIMIERDQYFPCFQELVLELEHINHIWNQYKKIERPENTINSAARVHTPIVLKSNAAPPPAVAELASLPGAKHENFRANLIQAKNTSANAIDISINMENLAQYERRWFELWTDLHGANPYSIDAQDFIPDFARAPSKTDGFDLKAISIYSWLRDSNRDSLMRNVFPSCFKLLEADWAKILKQYFYEFRPDCKDNRKIGDRFPEFLKTQCQEYIRDLPFLFELAEFEHLKQVAARKHELTEFSGDVYLGSTEQIKACRPLLNPELLIKVFSFPVFDIANAIKTGVAYSGAVMETPAAVALLPHSWTSKIVVLSELSYQIIEAVKTNDRSYSQLIASLMDDQQRQSSEEIARFIKLFQALHEEKLLIGCIPLNFKQETWSSYSQAVAKMQPHQTVERALAKFKEEKSSAGLAIDLGSGSGRDSRYLLSEGWHVLAVDSCEDALELLRSSEYGSNQELLSTYLGNMQNAPLPTADLVNAGLSLPFCPIDEFEKLWKNICKAIKPGGRFSGHFHGLNDDWAIDKSMSFHSSAQLKNYFKDFEIEWFNESEGPIPIVPTGFRHGHIFEIVARKL